MVLNWFGGNYGFIEFHQQIEDWKKYSRLDYRGLVPSG